MSNSKNVHKKGKNVKLEKILHFDIFVVKFEKGKNVELYILKGKNVECFSRIATL